MATLFRRHTPGGGVFVARNLHQNIHIMANLVDVLGRFVLRLGPQNVFVSIFESWSSDGTEMAVLKAQEILRGLGARTAVYTGSAGADGLVGGYAPEDASSTVNRIHYMARL